MKTTTPTPIRDLLKWPMNLKLVFVVLCVISLSSAVVLNTFAPYNEVGNELTSADSIWKLEEDFPQARLPIMGYVQDVRFVDDKRGFLISNSKIFETRDSGTTWSQVKIMLPKRDPIPAPPAPATSAPPAPAPASVENLKSDQEQIKPSDAEQSKSVPDTTRNSQDEPVLEKSEVPEKTTDVGQRSELGVDFLHNLVTLCISESKTVWVTTNLGVFSFPIDNPEAADWAKDLKGSEVFYFLDFYDEKNGWACSDKTLYHTANSGKTWNRCGEASLPSVSAPTGYLEYGPKFRTPVIVAADELFTIQSGVLYKVKNSTDGRFEFSIPTFGENGKKSVAWCSPRVSLRQTNKTVELFVLCGDTIYRFDTQNPNATWNALSESAIDFRATDFVSSPLLFSNELTGTLPVFDRTKSKQVTLKTEDGGASWKRVEVWEANARIQVRSAFGNVRYGIGVERNYLSYILRSDNSGRTWTQLTRSIDDLTWLQHYDGGVLAFGSENAYLADIGLANWRFDRRSQLSFDEIGARSHAWVTETYVMPYLDSTQEHNRQYLMCAFEGSPDYSIRDIQSFGADRKLLLSNDRIILIRNKKIASSFVVQLLDPLKGGGIDGGLSSFGAWASEDGQFSIIAIGATPKGQMIFWKDAVGDSLAVAESYNGSAISGNPNRIQMLGVAMTSQDRAIMVGLKGKLAQTMDGGRTWKELSSPTQQDLTHVCRSPKDPSKLWACGSNGTVIRSTDGGTTWESYNEKLANGSCLNKILFVDDQNGVIAGDNETLLVTNDGGKTWRSAPVYAQSPPRIAYWLIIAGFLFGFVGLYLPLGKKVASEQDSKESKDSIAQQYANDSPITHPDQDRMNAEGLAKGICNYLVHKKTRPPLTLAVTGEWGSGKSSLMNLIKRELEHKHWQPVWFNAWHFQNEENLLAALLQAVRQQAVPNWWSASGMQFRMSMLSARVKEHPIAYSVQLFVLVTCLCAAIFHWEESIQLIRMIASLIKIVTDQSEWIKSLSTPGIVGVPLILFFVWIYKTLKYLQPFNTNPIDLIRTIRGSNKELEDKTTFRDRFAENFKLVTNCMNPCSLVIFIDDLDRCQPENIMTVLQAVNFLISSGDCYVVLGMAKPRIEEAIAIERARHTASAKIELKETPQQFASSYLEKLVQITIPISEMGAEQAKRVVKDKDANNPTRFSTWGLAQLKLFGQISLLALIVVAAVFAGVAVKSLPLQNSNAPSLETSNVPFILKQSESTTSTSDRATGDESMGEVVSPEGPGNNFEANSRLAEIVEPSRKPFANEIEQASIAESNKRITQARWLRHLIVDSISGTLLVLAMFFTFRQLLNWVLNRSISEDSKKFDNAIDAWLPLFLVKERRPRLVKRLINKARLFAMLSEPEVTSTSEKKSGRLDPELIVAFTILTERKVSLFEGGKVSQKAIVDCINDSIKELDQQFQSMDSSEKVKIQTALQELVAKAKNVATRFNQPQVLVRLKKLADAARFV